VGSPLSRIRDSWQRLNFADRAASVVVLLYVVLELFRPAEARIPGLLLFRLLAFLALVYLVIRGLLWARTHLLWSLRNQLIAVYVFLAVVPMLLLLSMTALSFYLLDWHFGAYLVYSDLEERIEQVASTGETLTTAYALEIASTGAPTTTLSEPPPHTANFLAAAQESLPGLKIQVGAGEELLERASSPRRTRFAGLVDDHDALELRAVVERRVNGQRLIVSTSVPVTPEFMATMEPGLGPIQIDIARPAQQARPPGLTFLSRGRALIPVTQVEAPDRTLPPGAHWFDYSVTGFVRLDAVSMADVSNARADVPVILRYTARASQLNERLLALVGEWGGVAVTALLVAGIIFVLIELAAFAGSISLTRSITRAVDDLYRATRFVESGDFGHRVQIRQRDQLGDLGQSFNAMTESVGTLITEQRQRQRLEHELAIAREVQAQLFPREKPVVPGVEIDAVCRPARVVSGDYYDFLPLGPGRLGIALADISGKGISAALIMASLQAALRSQAAFNGTGSGGTAEIVTRLNQHLYRSTAPDRFATFFYGVYDTRTHRLEYTNAGHPAPLCINGQQVQHLSAGGTVLGLFDDCRYESQIIDVAPGSLLVAYSDGLTEAENSGGEEFGDQRVLDVALRCRQSSAGAVVKALLGTVDHWTGPVEQSDDVTIVVARF
jgi:sigma-B regulation protein RsbU (phosphoserine phosphatase)